ncbi:MAG: phytanoyl-CoA dioxygenase family protein [Alphaproteobacteria bacterium]|nr:phytanoyl-CoA dioxygenase family protein [Alphaproteobacteria bacterium]
MSEALVSKSQTGIDLTRISQHAANKPFIGAPVTAGQAAGPAFDGPLPAPTRDVDQLKADFDRAGYCLIAEAIDEPTRAALLDRVVEQYEGEREAGIALETEQRDARLTNLLMKGKIFQSVLLHPIADQILSHALGEGFLLSTLGSVRTLPGSFSQGLHVDQSYIGFPTPVPMVVNTVWMLEDFTEDNGATRIVPGSHRWDPASVAQLHEGVGLHAGTGLENPPQTVGAVAPARTCMVFDGRLLHGTGRNRSSDRTRTGVFAYYGRGYLRQFENPFLSIDDETMMSLDPEIRAQLGYRPWFFLGGSQIPGNPAPLDQVRPTRLTGVLRPRGRSGH